MKTTRAMLARGARCLLCNQTRRQAEKMHFNLHHIYEHLCYKKYVCEECKYASFSEEGMVIHKWKTSHRTGVRENKYKELMSMQIFMDCLRASQLGMHVVMARFENDGINLSDDNAGKDMVDLSANAQSGENNTASDILVASKSTEVPQLPPAFDEHPRLQLSGHSLATACKKKQKRTKADRAPKPPKMSKKDKKKVPVARDREFGAEGAVTGEIREVPARGKSSMPLPLNKIGKKSNEIAAGALIERRTENMEHANLPKFDGNSSGKEITALENTSSTNVPEQLEDRSQREVTTASNSDPRVSDLSEGRISDSSSFCTNAKRRRIESRNNRFATGANAVQPVDAAQFGQKHSASARNNRPVEARLTDADASESRSRNSSSNSKHIYFDNVAETRLPPRESSQRRSDEGTTRETRSKNASYENRCHVNVEDCACRNCLKRRPGQILSSESGLNRESAPSRKRSRRKRPCRGRDSRRRLRGEQNSDMSVQHRRTRKQRRNSGSRWENTTSNSRSSSKRHAEESSNAGTNAVNQTDTTGVHNLVSGSQDFMHEVQNRTSDGWTHETDSQRHGTDVADDSALRKKPRLPWHKRTPENNIRASEVNFSFKKTSRTSGSSAGDTALNRAVENAISFKVEEPDLESQLHQIPKPGDEQNKPPNAPQKSRTLVCRLCSQEVAEDYVDRRQHVIGKHLKCDFDERIRETLSSEIRRCFPGCLVYCDEQCIKCGKLYKSRSGRREHVRKDHEGQKLRCVMMNCTRREHAPEQLKRHLLFDHGVDMKLEKNEKIRLMFLRAKQDFYTALAPKILEYFPVALCEEDKCGTGEENSMMGSSFFDADEGNVSSVRNDNCVASGQERWDCKIEVD